MTRIHLRQLAPTIGDLDANIGLTTAAIRESIAAGAELVVMPELSLTGYMFDSVEELRTVAITRDHPVFAAWASEVAATNAVVIGGFAELGDDGQVFNSAAVVGRDGVLAVHRKDHLWDREKLIFTPGSAIPPVIDTPVGRLGILICYDVEFPEMTRSLALRGADLIVVPTNWPLETTPAGEHVPEVIIAMAAAHTNHAAVVCCDRSGLERGQEWNEASCAINQDGWVVATADAHGIVTADLDLSLSRNKRVTALVDAFGDRRPELYGIVTEPKADIANERLAVQPV
jgi:5-aminopentanamidase